MVAALMLSDELEEFGHGGSGWESSEMREECSRE